MEMLVNLPLLTAFTAIGLAQLIKIPLYFIPHKTWNWHLMFSTGGMPSSHSAAVTALSTSIAMEYGLDSPLFAISAVFGVIVMFDSAGVRRYAGEQAIVLNQLIEDLNGLVEDLKNWRIESAQEKRNKLKVLLGHQPSEVFVGGLFGVGVAFGVDALVDLIF